MPISNKYTENKFFKINKMKISFKHISYFLLFILGINMTLISCTSDLDVTPGDDDEFYLKLSFRSSIIQTSISKIIRRIVRRVMTETDQQILPDLEETLVVTFAFFCNARTSTDKKHHCVGRWYLPTMNTQTWSPANEF
jgi:hypothetical protein